MGADFRLARALFVIDGVVYHDSHEEWLAEVKEIPFFYGRMDPGEHVLQVVIELRGCGSGLTAERNGFRFDLRSSHTFTVPAGRNFELRVVVWDRGAALFTPFPERPALRYEEQAGETGSTVLSPDELERS